MILDEVIPSRKYSMSDSGIFSGPDSLRSCETYSLTSEVGSFYCFCQDNPVTVSDNHVTGCYIKV